MTTTRGPQSHDPRHQAEADLQEKGLRAGSVGLLGGVVLGISSVAPAYALTATIGILVAEATRWPLSSSPAVLGVGLVLVLGLGLIAIGLLFMLWQRSRDPAFFRGETLVKDTPALVVED